MSKKILSIILTIAVILCQGTLCLGTVYATDGEMLVERGETIIPLDASAWTKSTTGNITLSNDADGALVFNDTGSENTKKDRYDSGWLELGNISIDVTNVYAIEFKAKLENAKGLSTMSDTNVVWDKAGCRPQFYYQGNPGISITEANSTGSNIQYIKQTNSDGKHYNDDYVTYYYELGGSWDALETLTKLRYDPLKNAGGTIRIKDMVLISKPGVVKMTYNGMTDADLSAMPVNPETIELVLTNGVSNVTKDTVSLTDADGFEVELADARASGNNVVIEFPEGTSLNPFEEYTITLKDGVMVSNAKALCEPIPVTFYTSDERVLTAIEIIDPNRPSDELPEDVDPDNVWALEFKEESDVSNWSKDSSKNAYPIYELAHEEYLKYTSGTYKHTSSGSGEIIDANYYGYYNVSNDKPLDMNKYTKLQIRFKVFECTTNSNKLQIYFQGVNDDGSSLNISETNSVSFDYVSMGENNSSEWIIAEVDLSNKSMWAKGKSITRFRADFMKNAAGYVLVDYIRFIGVNEPEIESITYTDANGSSIVTDDVFVPADATSLEIALTHPVASVSDAQISLINDYGNKATLDKVSLDSTGKIITIKLSEQLEKSAVYTLTAEPILSGIMSVSNPLVASFKTELDPLNVEIIKAADGKSATVEYTNATADDVVLVAIATCWKQTNVAGRVEYLGKNMAVNSIAAGDSANAYLTYDVDTENGEFVEIAVWKYDTATGVYSVLRIENGGNPIR